MNLITKLTAIILTVAFFSMQWVVFFWVGAEMKTYLGITEFGWALFIYLGVLTLFVMAVVG